MKISASILAIKDKDVFEALEINRKKYDLVHVDIGDNVFCPTFGIKYETLYRLCNEYDYLIDIHFMIQDPKSIQNRIKDLRISNITVHFEATSLEVFEYMKSDTYTLGIGVLSETNLADISDFIDITDSVLLLCVNPGYSYQKPTVSPVDRVKEFIHMYPNFKGQISVDGGVSDELLPQLRALNVDIAVQGGAIFA